MSYPRTPRNYPVRPNEMTPSKEYAQANAQAELPKGWRRTKGGAAWHPESGYTIRRARTGQWYATKGENPTQFWQTELAAIQCAEVDIHSDPIPDDLDFVERFARECGEGPEDDNDGRYDD